MSDSNKVVTISSLSTLYVRQRIRVEDNGVEIDPNTLLCRMAFKAEDVSPTAPDWMAAGWETDASGKTTVYYARCLVGPTGTITLPVGRYVIWIEITSAPQKPVLRGGVLVVE